MTRQLVAGLALLLFGTGLVFGSDSASNEVIVEDMPEASARHVCFVSRDADDLFAFTASWLSTLGIVQSIVGHDWQSGAVESSKVEAYLESWETSLDCSDAQLRFCLESKNLAIRAIAQTAADAVQSIHRAVSNTRNALRLGRRSEGSISEGEWRAMIALYREPTAVLLKTVPAVHGLLLSSERLLLSADEVRRLRSEGTKSICDSRLRQEHRLRDDNDIYRSICEFDNWLAQASTRQK